MKMKNINKISYPQEFDLVSTADTEEENSDIRVRVFCIFYDVFDTWYLGFVCPHQFEFVSTGNTEEENGGQNKQLQSDRLDAAKYILHNMHFQ